ncbi:MAG: DUF1415 domain-containing protein [Gammaproteobacteria bacterium]|nr:DUF1415 domain-containing protein [Gammaproteobacteria bacterium]
MNSETIIKATQNWVNNVVIALNLCPFAKAEVIKGRVRYFVSEAHNEEQLLIDLSNELEYLEQHNEIETTLLMHPQVLIQFSDYNNFLSLADALLENLEYEGIYQIASFHPDYQFENTNINDAENYSNKSPYPMLHLIREVSLERATANYPDPENIPQRNIAVLKQLGSNECEKQLQACFIDNQND